jgi:hypothetical protein
MLITMHVGELLSFWARTLTTAYSVLAFFGYLGFVYAGPIADQKSEPLGRPSMGTLTRSARLSSRSSPGARRHWNIKYSTRQLEDPLTSARR